MGIIEQVALDQTLHTVTIGRQLLLERGKRSLEAQRRKGVAIVQPIGQDPQHQHQPPRIGAGVVLAQAELRGMQCRIDHPALDAPGGQIAKQLQHQGFDLIDVGRRHALQADAKTQLRQIGLDAAASQILTQTRIDQRLPQRRAGGADQRVVEDLQRPALIDIDIVGKEPVERDKGLGLIALGPIDCVGIIEPLRCGEAALGADCRIDGVRLVVAEVFLQER